MTKELFTIIIDCIASIPVDEWEINKETSENYYWAQYKTMVFNSIGEMRISECWQNFSWLQTRKLKRIFNEIKEEIATRAIQRLCDIA